MQKARCKEAAQTAGGGGRGNASKNKLAVRRRATVARGKVKEDGHEVRGRSYSHVRLERLYGGMEGR